MSGTLWMGDHPDHYPKRKGDTMSTKTKTTLWEAQFAPDDYPRVVDAHSRVCICPSVDTNEHARLIAAAPDLLAALEALSQQDKEALETLEKMGMGHDLPSKETLALMEQARAAIARARATP